MRVIISSYFLRQAQRSSSFVAAGAAAADTQQINRSFFRLFLSRAFARPLLASLVLSVPANWLSSFCFPTGTSIYRRLVSLGKLAFLLRSRGWFASRRRDARKDAEAEKEAKSLVSSSSSNSARGNHLSSGGGSPNDLSPLCASCALKLRGEIYFRPTLGAPERLLRTLGLSVISAGSFGSLPN